MTDQNITAIPDPYSDADTAKANGGKRHYFGSLLVDAYNAVLVKGQGKVVFDPLQHGADQRVTAIEIVLTPLPRPGATEYQIRREIIAQSAEWTKTVRPSIEKLGLTLKGLNNKWAQIDMIDTGRTYTNKNGETKSATSIRFLAVYESQRECQDACDAYYAGRARQREAAEATQPAPAPTPANGTNGMNGTNDAQRATAAKFLPALWNSARSGGADGTVDRFLNSIQKNPLTARYFDINSSEVIEIISANA